MCVFCHIVLLVARSVRSVCSCVPWREREEIWTRGGPGRARRGEICYVVLRIQRQGPRLIFFASLFLFFKVEGSGYGCLAVGSCMGDLLLLLCRARDDVQQ